MLRVRNKRFNHRAREAIKTASMAAKQDEEVPRNLLSATLAVAWEPDVKSRLREHEAKLVAQQKVQLAVQASAFGR